MPYNIQIRNYNERALFDGRTERTPLSVAGTTSTDGTFSTITLDSTLANGNINLQQQQNDVTTPRSSFLHLLLFVSLALVGGIILFHHGVWWAIIMHAALISTGMASLLAGRANKNIHLVTLSVWTLSAMVGLVLFSIFVVWRGRDYIPEWCLAYANDKYLDHEITMGVCATLEDDGTFEKIWIGAIVLGVLLGFPFLFFAVLTVHRFYIDATV